MTRGAREVGWAALAGIGLTAAGWATAPSPAAALSCPAWAPVCMLGQATAGVATTGATSIAGDLAGGVAEAVLDTVAAGFLEAYLLMFRWATTWWLTFTMSPHALVGTIDSSFPATIAYIAAFVMVLAVLSSAITTIWRRDGAVVADAAAGVFKAVLVIGGAWAALGVAWRLADQLTAALAPSAANISVDPDPGHRCGAGRPRVGRAGHLPVRGRLRAQPGCGADDDLPAGRRRRARLAAADRRRWFPGHHHPRLAAQGDRLAAGPDLPAPDGRRDLPDRVRVHGRRQRRRPADSRRARRRRRRDRRPSRRRG